MEEVVLETNLGGARLMSRGKVRDMYDLGDRLLIVATDRISAFDSILPTGIPSKGKVLNQISAYWFDYTKDLVKNHMISIDVRDFPEEVRNQSEMLEGRSMLVKKAERIDIECVVRGYLAGSAWQEYKESGSVCGLKLPSGLVESEKLPGPIFTPAMKSDTGHDVNISEKKLEELVGLDLAAELKEKSIRIFEKAAAHTLQKGIIIADTKFEFGRIEGEVILIDELLTPDSSRFWSVDGYAPGVSQESFDKQFVRDYLIKIGWDKEPPAPSLPEDIARKTQRRYIEAYKRIVGKELI